MLKFTNFDYVIGRQQMAASVLLVCFGLIGNISSGVFAFTFGLGLGGIWYGYALASFTWTLIFTIVLSGVNILPSRILGIKTKMPSINWVNEKERAIERIKQEAEAEEDDFWQKL